MNRTEKSITLAWTGASGAPYGLKLLASLLAADYKVFLLISSAAKIVLRTEANFELPEKESDIHQALVSHFNCQADKLVLCSKEEWFSPVASGSAAPRQMVVCPCSCGTLAAIAHGLSDNLIERAADVVIKEKGQLILMVRESPLSTLHLANMHQLSQMGVTIMPAAPGFYHQPESIMDLVDFMVGRVLDHLQIDQKLVPRWGQADQ